MNKKIFQNSFIILQFFILQYILIKTQSDCINGCNEDQWCWNNGGIGECRDCTTGFSFSTIGTPLTAESTEI
jgi:hypothetical protein